MNIKSTLLFLLLFSFQSFSQNVAIELVEINMLYRGYDVAVKLSVNDSKKGEIMLSGTNVEIVKSADSHYIVKAGKEASVELIVLRKRKSKIDTLCRKMYMVFDIPNPTLYWGGSMSGTKSKRSEFRLFAKYPAGIPLNASHRIVKWELIYGDKIISGINADLSRAKDLIDSLPSGATVTIKCEVEMPTREVRTIYGAWQLE